MDQGKSIDFEENPRRKANVFSFLTFFYNYPLIKKSRKVELQEDDIYKVLPSFSSQNLGDKLESNWKRAKKHKSTPLVKSIVVSFGAIYLLYCVIQLILGTALMLLQPVLFSKFVAYFQPEQSVISKKDFYLYAMGILGFNLFNVLFNENMNLWVAEYTIKVRTAICSLMYRKALRINYSTFTDISIGKIITLVTKDVATIESCLGFMKDMIISVLQLIVVTIILYMKVGISAFPAIGLVMIVIPVQIFIGRKTTFKRLETFIKSDERLLFIQEALSAVKIIKMYVWEKYFVNLITKARRWETDKIKDVYYLKVLVLCLGRSTINLAFYILIISYVATGYQLEAETVYFVQQCLQFLTKPLANSIPFGIVQTSDAIAAVQRIQGFLDADEIKKIDTTITPSDNPEVLLDKVLVNIKGRQVLNAVSIHLEKGLLLLTGNTGSGKSVILNTILGEYPVSKGKFWIKGTMSYASETPWLFPSTIRQNILFGEEFDKNRYEKVISVCALTYDINQFDKLDQTIVGDKGFNLSKGQQARITLARAVYKNSDIYLLDDCLASLDNNVARHIFENCIKGFLKDKICIFVTNNINNIVSVPTGSVLYVENGTTLDLDQQNDSLDKRITFYMDEIDGFNMNEISKYASRQSKLNTLKEENDNDTNGDDANEESNLLVNSDQYEVKRNLYQELNKDGDVSWSIYVKYFKYLGGICSVLIFFVGFLLAQVAASYSDKLISQWVNLEPKITNLTNSNLTNTEEYESALTSRDLLLKIYTVVILASFVLAVIRNYLSIFFSMKAARRLHKAMIMAIINACMYFFDNHYIGNIINRLAKDFHVIDEYLPFLILEIFRVIFAVGGIVVLLSSVSWQFSVPAAFLFVKMYFIRRMCLPAVRSLRRLEASTRSPVVGYLNSSLEGLVTIRAFNKEQLLIREFDRHQDVYTSACDLSRTVGAFFALILNVFGVFFIMSIIGKLMFFDTGTQPGDVGLAISQAMSLALILQYTISIMTEVESALTSVERVIEYTDVEIEEKSGELCHDWPKIGRIIYSNVSLTYRTNENTVLKNISFEIDGQNKIGIVGRTGAGKSSIISTLYRLYDFTGDIYIDGENTKNLNLDFLRANIGIIPQDPFLFSGSIRTNLDPLNRFTDSDIWLAVSKVGLKELIPSLDEKLSSATTNFSSGQKQLLCMARALLRDQKIIVLDEPTANIDPETDFLIQNVIRENFKKCTVIIIAHRLNSILNCDKILVLDTGNIVEYDKPKNLLDDKNSLFYKMTRSENLDV